MIMLYGALLVSSMMPDVGIGQGQPQPVPSEPAAETRPAQPPHTAPRVGPDGRPLPPESPAPESKDTEKDKPDEETETERPGPPQR